MLLKLYFHKYICIVHVIRHLIKLISLQTIKFIFYYTVLQDT